ncbi:MAG TPA: hypothetical protein VGK78_03720 [Nocardioides sp.]|uniref:hypothetical protein n=1 Tax=Nocardioides sp. TaxID=35761 RepID=UPI002F3E93A5
MHHLLAGLAIAAPFTLGVAVTPSGPAGDRVFSFDDPAIVEASALVAENGLFLTTNDSGDTGRVFAVDDTGRTVGVTHWSDDPTDTEALAPAGNGFVWVGDIGDNLGHRSSVDIARVPVGPGDRTVHATTYRLTYPDGATDAETLLRDPATGRLYIATKNVFGGVLYAVPEHLHANATNRLHSIGRVLPVATDGSFFPDGKHLVVRNYSTAVVYAWPSLQPVGSFALPHQRQGEGIAVASDGEVYVSSEGPHAPVLRVRLPKQIQDAVRPAVSAAPSNPSSSRSDDSDAARSSDPAEVEPASRDAWPWVAGGLFGLVALGVLVRALRPH